ncbi:MAG: hypothetical protein M3T96_04805, partial [Acidobacteriota bacterium]|nr:hypothetical protein [Acidobacteriota bacterium]
AEPSYEITLQTVVASNNTAEKSNLSATLSTIVKKLKTEFPYTDFRLSQTFMQRVANNGSVELNSVSYEVKQDKSLPVFSEWTVSGLQNIADDNGQEVIQIQNFHFGQRVPIKNINDSVNYEPVGLTSRFSLMKNTPTVVGSLTTSRPDELMFLILTVKSADK